MTHDEILARAILRACVEVWPKSTDWDYTPPAIRDGWLDVLATCAAACGKPVQLTPP